VLSDTTKEIDMRKRYKMGKKKSRKTFSKTAAHSHKRNASGRPMRGGIRL